MSLLDTIFNMGLKAIKEQEQILSKATPKLIKETDGAKRKIDKAVERLELARAGRQQAEDNTLWVSIELYRNQSTHSYSALKDLYEQMDSNELEETILDHLVDEHYPIALADVKEIADNYQGYINEFEDSIQVLIELIKEHSSDSNVDQLNELADRFYTLANEQIKAINNHLADYGIDELIR